MGMGVNMGHEHAHDFEPAGSAAAQHLCQPGQTISSSTGASGKAGQYVVILRYSSGIGVVLALPIIAAGGIQVLRASFARDAVVVDVNININLGRGVRGGRARRCHRRRCGSGFYGSRCHRIRGRCLRSVVQVGKPPRRTTTRSISSSTAPP